MTTESEPAAYVNRRRIPVATVAATLALACLMFAALLGVDIQVQPAGNKFEAPDSSIARRAVFLSVFVLALFGAMVSRFKRALSVPPAVWMMLAWCLISVAWSVAPEIALRRAILLLVIVVTAFLCVNVLGYRALKTIGFVLAAILAFDWLSLLFLQNAVHLPNDPDATLAGRWRGLHAHKNAAGFVMAVSFLLYIFLPPTRSRVVQAILITGSVLFLVYTGSKTSMAALSIALIVSAAYYFMRPRPVHFGTFVLLAILAAFVLATILLSIYAAPDISLWEDERAFTGRGLIWEQVLRLAMERPVLGYGYGSFWGLGDVGPMAAYYYSWSFLAIENAHNGYIDVIASIGVLGLVFVIFALFVAPIGELLSDSTTDHSVKSLLLSWIVFSAVHNLAETSLLNSRGASVMNLLAVALVYSLAATRSES